MAAVVDWYQSLFELIDMRSFSNLWFWIALGVVWSTASYYVLGVPFDMIQRSRRQGDQANADLEDMVRINVNRLLYIAHVTGLLAASFVCFALTTLAILAFYYKVEFAQALFLLALPLTGVGLLSVSTARLIQSEDATGERLYKRLMRHRLYTQIIGMIAIFVTAMWGMYQNLSVGPFGGY